MFSSNYLNDVSRFPIHIFNTPGYIQNTGWTTSLWSFPRRKVKLTTPGKLLPNPYYWLAWEPSFAWKLSFSYKSQPNQHSNQAKHFCGSTKFLNTSLYCAGRAKYKLINLSSLNKENRIYIRGEFTSKKRKTAILLYCFYNAGVFHIFVLYNLLGPWTSFYRKFKINIKRKPNYEIGWFHNWPMIISHRLYAFHFTNDYFQL